jgi:hypothetical protein
MFDSLERRDTLRKRGGRSVGIESFGKLFSYNTKSF